jgi:hypothetical protein
MIWERYSKVLGRKEVVLMFDFLKKKAKFIQKVTSPPSVKPDMSNPHQLPICSYYGYSRCIDNSKTKSEIQYLDFEYFNNPMNKNGACCVMFRNGFYCPFFKWMESNRKTRGWS